MRKWGRRSALAAAILASGAMLWGVMADRAALGENFLRLHVVGASDSVEDQQVKLAVRDVVLDCLSEGLAEREDIHQACAYIEEMLPVIRERGDAALAAAGFSQHVTVTLAREPFPVREYEDFSLPSGVYRTLRVVIGEGEGQNWWCVVFPRLCYGGDLSENGEKSHIQDSLYDTITGKYEIRFWLLDKLGELENFLFRASEEG